MSKDEAAVIMAFTGVMLGKFSHFHAYAEKIIGRPIFTHEFGSKLMSEEIKKAAKDDFLKINDSIIN